jgi:hypothetical protein
MLFDRFPSTHRTWLHQRLSEAGPRDRDLLQHLMARYAEPLEAYAQASSLRDAAEPTELVNDFFASRLGEPEYLARWAASGMPLRRWLMNGLILHARGLRRDAARDWRRQASAEDDGQPIAPEPDAEARFERAWARRMLELAVDAAGEAMRLKGRQRAFELFRRHIVGGLPYRQAVADLGYSVAEAKSVVRTATKHVHEALLEALREEGVPEPELDREADRLQRLIAS